MVAVGMAVRCRTVGTYQRETDQEIWGLLKLMLYQTGEMPILHSEIVKVDLSRLTPIRVSITSTTQPSDEPFTLRLEKVSNSALIYLPPGPDEPRLTRGTSPKGKR